MSSILDVTENQIFQTLGRGKAPAYKPIEKPGLVEKPISVKFIPSPEVDEFMKKLIEDMNELNTGINGIQKLIKWFIIPLFFAVLASLLVLILRA